MVVQYTKGCNFTTPIDTFRGLKLANANTYYSYRFEQQYIDYTGYANNFFNMDILIVLYPSGRIYKMTGITHDTRTMSEKSNQSYGCSVDISYNVNGTDYVCAGQVFTTGHGNAARVSWYGSSYRRRYHDETKTMRRSYYRLRNSSKVQMTESCHLKGRCRNCKKIYSI